MPARKPPKIPSELIIEALSGETDAVIAGFMRILIFLCDRCKADCSVEDERMMRLSGLSAPQWSKCGKHIKELFLTFQTPFLTHWQHRVGVATKSMPLVIKAKEARLLRAKQRNAKKLQDKDLSSGQGLLPQKMDKGILTDWEQSGRFDPIARQDALANKRITEKTPFKPKLTDS